MDHQHKPETAVADDPQARELLRRAFENTARWQPDFKGFTADLTVNVNGQETSGPVIVKSPREVSVQLSDADVQKWAATAIHTVRPGAVLQNAGLLQYANGTYSLTRNAGMARTIPRMRGA